VAAIDVTDSGPSEEVPLSTRVNGEDPAPLPTRPIDIDRQDASLPTRVNGEEGESREEEEMADAPLPARARGEEGGSREEEEEEADWSPPQRLM